jgi:hypothetical protein
MLVLGYIPEFHVLVLQFFLYQSSDFQAGFKYLGFYIKPSSYGINDWKWLSAKVEKRINLWCNRAFPRGELDPGQVGS